MTRLTTGFEAESLVSRQLELWRARQQKLVETQQGRVAEKQFGPYVAVSRDFGSGGTEISRRIADRLGWELFDREIVEAMARQAHLREEVFESLDEHGRSKIEDWMRGFLEQRWVGQDVYRHYLAQVLNTIALHGYAVIIGRGAPLLLPPEAGLRVKFVALLGDRVRRVQEREAVTAEAARRLVKEADEQRHLYLRNILNRRSEEFTDYDLVLNTSTLSIETIVGLVVQGVVEKTDAQAQKEVVL